jgi:quinoprotein glucose dehydrogenase
VTFARVSSLLLFLAAGPPLSCAQDVPTELELRAGDSDLERARQLVKVPPGFQVQLFASEPDVLNPVALAFDERGRCFVVETFRRDKQVLDMRDHREWVEDDLASRTVEDRVAFLQRYARDGIRLFREESERVRLLVDGDGDGRADSSTVFADGFDGLTDGIAAGVLARRGDVWFTDIPNLWRLRERGGSGHADERERVATGFGVHFNYTGHDLHGLRVGPDGRLYFSIGDRGLHVTTKEGRLLDLPDAGAVLRCELDGSGLELFHTGLRNPQELAFDDAGDLFTVDNNSDAGDRARLVHVVEGGDSGWCIGFQWIESPTPRGPWNSERMWEPQNDVQPAWILPPVANLVSGPSGLAHYPGTGFSDPSWRDVFFVCDFEGETNNTRVVAFQVAPDGAGHRLVSQSDFVARGIVATDCDFGPDGALYVTDWVHGWQQPGRGRVWRISDPAALGSAAVVETKRLIGEGMAGRSRGDLVGRLANPDQRVRTEAELALAGMGDEGLLGFRTVLDGMRDRLARLHAVWGLGIVARRDAAHRAEAVNRLVHALDDGDAEVRAQAARVLGDAAIEAAGEALVARLADPCARVRFLAAQALVHVAPESLGDAQPKELLLALHDLLAAHGDDPTERFAAARALAACADDVTLRTFSEDAEPRVRMGVVLAMRRRAMADVADFLDDSDERIAREAARAIHDAPIAAALPALAELLEDDELTDSVTLGRSIGANFRLGGIEAAQRLAAAVELDFPAGVRAEALRALRDFDEPPARDRLLGVWRPCAKGRAPVAAAAVAPRVGRWLEDRDGEVREAAVRFVQHFELPGHGAELAEVVADPTHGDAPRIAALETLTTLHDEHLRGSIEVALVDDRERVRGAGGRALAKLDPALALDILRRVVEGGGPYELQDAFATLGEMEGPGAAALLAHALDRLNEGQLAPEATLDLLEVAKKRTADAAIVDLLAKFEASRKSGDPLAPFRECQAGGNADRGRNLFFQRNEFECAKCHRVGGEGAGVAGPDLAGIGGRATRDYLLESIVLPDAKIAPGFQSTIFFLKGGGIVDGRVEGEDATRIQVFTLDQGSVLIDKEQIASRSNGKSAMLPDLVKKMNKRELRDLIEFLASLKQS